MRKPNSKAGSRAMSVADRFLWLAILGPVLAVSAWSLFYVARHLGVPTPVAWAFSACFDGATLLAAKYSLKYAEEGLSGTFPRTVVRVWALLAAFVQTLHATLAHEPRAAVLVWASLPITAVVIYEIHTRWVRRTALAKAGTIYPAALPGFGALTWIMFPWKTWFAMRDIVGKRRNAIVSAVGDRPAVMSLIPHAEIGPTPTPTPTPTRSPIVPGTVTSIGSHRPTAHIRAWAEETGRIKPGQVRGPLKASIIEAYNAEHTTDMEEASGE